MIFIKDIFPSLAVCFLLALASIAGTVGCIWFVFMTIDDIQENRRRRRKEREWERLELEAKKRREEDRGSMS